MKFSLALALVLDLAKQNALDPEKCDPELEKDAQQQAQAIEVVAITLERMGPFIDDLVIENLPLAS